jgi:hypothetical protein
MVGEKRTQTVQMEPTLLPLSGAPKFHKWKITGAWGWGRIMECGGLLCTLYESRLPFRSLPSMVAKGPDLEEPQVST